MDQIGFLKEEFDNLEGKLIIKWRNKRMETQQIWFVLDFNWLDNGELTHKYVSEKPTIQKLEKLAFKIIVIYLINSQWWHRGVPLQSTYALYRISTG